MVAVKLDILVLFGLLNHEVALSSIHTLNPCVTFLGQVSVTFVRANGVTSSSNLASSNSLSTLLSCLNLIFGRFDSSIRDLCARTTGWVPIIAGVFISITISHFIILIHLIDVIVLLLVIRMNASDATHTSSTVYRVVNAASVRVLGYVILLLWSVG
jgi:hypothetical protein